MKTILASTIALLLGAVTLVAADKDKDKGAVKPYPASLKTCVVSGDTLGEMGKPVIIVKDGQEVKLCCKDCIKDFNKDPQKYLKMIQEKSKK
jgi:hypothetical protein